MVGRPVHCLLLVGLSLLLVGANAQAVPGKDWPQRMVGATAETGRDGTGIVVAVLDSGIDHTHPDLAGKFWSNPAETANGLDDDLDGRTDDLDGWDFCNDAPPRQRPGFGHGTLVAGVLAAQGVAGGVRGAAPGVRLMDVQVYCDDNEYPTPDAFLGRDSLRQGLRYAIDHGADIILMSLQLWEDQDPGLVAGLFPTAEEFQAAHDAGIVVVGAAGNFGDLGPQAPGNQPHVLTVGATTGCGFRHGFSNHGVGVDLWAPGRAHAPSLGGGHEWVAGTSFAAPLVAGAAALLLEAEPDLAPDAVASRLLAFARPSEDGPLLDLHGLLAPAPLSGSARLAFRGPTAVHGPHYLQYVSHGDEPSLLQVGADGYGRYCFNLADDLEDRTYAVGPGEDERLQVAARAFGPTWAGPWLNRTITYDGDAEPNEERPVWVDGGREDAGESSAKPIPSHWLLGLLGIAVALARRQ